MILLLCEGNNYIKKEQTVDGLNSTGNFLAINNMHDLLINFQWHEVEDGPLLIMRKQFPEYVQDNLTHDFYFALQLDFATTGILCIPLKKKRLQGGLLSVRGAAIPQVISATIARLRRLCTILEEELYHNPRRSIIKMMVLDRCSCDELPAEIECDPQFKISILARKKSLLQALSKRVDFGKSSEVKSIRIQ